MPGGHLLQCRRTRILEQRRCSAALQHRLTRVALHHGAGLALALQLHGASQRRRPAPAAPVVAGGREPRMGCCGEHAHCAEARQARARVLPAPSARS